MLVLLQACAPGGCRALEMLPSSVRMAYQSWRLTCMGGVILGPEGGSKVQTGVAGESRGLHLRVTTQRADQADLAVSQ